MKHSRDPTTRAIYQRRLALDQEGHVGTGRKNAPALEVERLENLVKLERITNQGQFGRTGVGFTRSKVPRTQQAVRRRMSAILKMEAEEKRIAVCFEYKMQTNWMSWDRLSAHEKKDITWHKMLHVYSESLLKFTLNAITRCLHRIISDAGALPRTAPAACVTDRV